MSRLVTLQVLLGAILAAVAAAQQQVQLFPLGEFQVNAHTPGGQYGPRVAGDRRGNFLVVWAGAGASDPDGVFARAHSSAGAPIGSELRVNTNTADTQGDPNIDANSDGDFVVVWEKRQGLVTDGLFGQRYESSGLALGTEFQVNTDPVYVSTRPDVALDAQGDFVVVWGDIDAPFYILGRRFDSSGGALGSDFQINSFTDSDQYNPSVAADAAGNFTVVWHGQNYDFYRDIAARRYDGDGNALAAEFIVNTYTEDDRGLQPAVAAEESGGFVAAWESRYQDGSTYGVFSRRYAAGGTPRGGEFQVNAHTVGSQAYPAVETDSRGNFVVAWVSYGQDGDDEGVFAQRYDSSGAPRGTEFQVNSYTAGGQGTYSGLGLTVDADGDFVVAWDSLGQDGNGSGVFARRFAVGYELARQAAANGGTATTDIELNGADGSDRLESSLTTPNAGDVIIVEKPITNGPPSGFTFIGQQVDITAPAASAGTPLRIVFELDRSLFAGNVGNPNVQVYRNGLLVPNCAGSVTVCTGGPTMASPDPCVANRCLQGDLDAELTVLTSAASDWNFAVPCATGFAKGLFLVKEKVPGREKLIAKLIGGPALAQEDFGNPLAIGGTSYRLRVYDDAQALVADIPVERAGDTTCSGGATSCWKALGGAPPDGKGYKYKDSDAAANGATQLMLKSSASSKLLFKAKGPAPPFPNAIAAALTSTSAVTIELHGNDAPAGCFAATLSDIKTQEPDAFKAK